MASESKDNSSKRDAKYFSKVVGKAIDVLEILKRSSQPLSLNTLTKRLGMAKSSAFRILHTLEAAGYLEKDGGGQYSLSAELRQLVPTYLLNNLIELASPGMRELRRKFGETVSLAVLFDNHIEVVAVLESSYTIRMGNTVGRIIPPHASSLGKAITANQSEERREVLLRSYGLHGFTPNTITDESELKAEFERVRRRGYAMEKEESTPDGYCFGVPIWHEGRVIAAISVAVPKMRLPKKKEQDELIQSLTALAKATGEGLADREAS